MRIVFCGTPEFSVSPLKKLIDKKLDVVAVYTQPDKGVGRGRKVQYSAVKQCAIDHNLLIHQPKSLKSTEAIEQLKDLQPDLMIVVAYGLILPPEVLDIPTISCWNIHASLLPRWRGAAPIHRALIAGDKTTGVGIMQMEAGLDTGAVYLQHECLISDNETAQKLHDKLSIMGGYALIEAIELLECGLLPEPIQQDKKRATYARKLEKSESKITWLESAFQIQRKVRAFNPWPGVVATIKGEPYKLWCSNVLEFTNEIAPGEPGDIIKADKSTLVIQCHDSALQIDEIQKPGKKRMAIKQFMQSRKDWYT